MSLPPAQKDVSAHPAAGSVTAPVDKTKMHADVERKIRFYGVIEAFRAGCLPDNAQIDSTLKYLADHTLVDTTKLSPGGQKLVEDTRAIINTAREIVKQKNAEELFQNFIWHTRAIDTTATRDRDRDRDRDQAAPVSAEEVKADTQQAAHHLRTLLTIFLANGEARKLISDMSVIGRDLLARTAEQIRPDEAALGRVDEPGPADQFQPRQRKEANADQKAARTAQGRVVDDSQRAVGEAAQGSADQAAATTSNGNSSSNGKQKSSIRERFTAHIPQNKRGKATEHIDRAKDFLRHDYFPPERRDRFILRFKKVILECQKNEDYQKSIAWMLDTLNVYAEHGRTARREGKARAKGMWDDPTLRQASGEISTLLERFANNQSTKPARNSVRRLFDDANEDEELRAWFGKCNKWFRRMLLEPGYVLEKECNEDGVQLRESGRKFYDERYKQSFDLCFDAVRDWFAALTSDPLNTRFGEDWTRLTRDFLFSPEGRLTWKPELWTDIRRVVVPEIVDRVGYIPIPRAEYTDDNLDLVVENLTLTGRNLFPNIVSVEAHNFLKFSPYETIQDETRHEFTFTLGQMQADMRDVMFYFNKKSVPKLKDSGIADIVLGGEGITAKVHLRGAGQDSSSVFHVVSINVKVSSLKFSIRDSKHDGLYKILRPLATAVVKRQIQRALRDALRTGLELIDDQLVKVRERMDEARQSKEGRLEVLKDMLKHKTDEASVKGKEKVEKRQSHFKVVAKRDSLLLPEYENPEGWVHKQQEVAEAAKEGPEWRSKVFTIVPQEA